MFELRIFKLNIISAFRISRLYNHDVMVRPPSLGTEDCQDHFEVVNLQDEGFHHEGKDDLQP